MSTSKTVEQRIDNLEKRVTKLETVLVSSNVDTRPDSKAKKLSAKEFLMTKELKTETQKVLVLGYYFEHIVGMESFNIVDLEATFRSAKERLPKNMNDAANKNIARGFLMEVKEKKDNKKAWVLTSTGEKYVENELNK